MFIAVLCGGAGTRLHPLTQDLIPKVLAPVKGYPFLYWKLRNLHALGYTDVLLLAGHLWDQVDDYLAGAVLPEGMRVRLHIDPQMGMGLALNNAVPVLPERFWLTYGDCLLDYDPLAVERARVAGGWDAMQTVTPHGVDYGALIVPRKAWGKWRKYHDTLDLMLRMDVMGQHVVNARAWEINTPESLRAVEAYL